MLHAQGFPWRVRVLTGASTGSALDDTLAESDAIAWRAPYQSSRKLRQSINAQRTQFVDMHLSHVPQMVEFGFLGKLDFAIVEGVDISPEGRVVLSASVGATPSFLRNAERVVIELNRAHSQRLVEMHDITPPPTLANFSVGGPGDLPIDRPLAKVGKPYVEVDPKKIVGVVETDEPDGVGPFDPPEAQHTRIADHVVEFLVREMRAGRIPPQFLPLQAGVGNVANAVMAGLGSHDEIPNFSMYTEVFQDSLVDLMARGRLLGASSTALTLSQPQLDRVYADMDFFAPRIVLRSQEVSNNPGIVRRLGVISINTVLEMDIVGCANSTHVAGTQLMNGIGGSGDFTRNAYLSILVAPSVAKGGAISTVVPMVSHCDHNEHSVQVLVTEQGLADLRGLGPQERAHAIIENCAHPTYRPYLHKYLECSPLGHIRHDLARCFELHRNLLQTGRMLPA